MVSKEKFSGIAAGLFLAGITLAGVYYFQPDVLNNEVTPGIDIEDARNILIDNDFVILSDNDYEEIVERNNELLAENEVLISHVSELTESVEVINEENSKLRKELNTLLEHEAAQEKEMAQEEDQTNDTSIQSNILSVKPGMNSIQISHQLENLNIINDSSTFESLIFSKGLDQKIQVGNYELNNQMSYEEIITIITSS